MPNLSFLFRTDFHLTDKNPSSWKGDYMSEILSNVEQVGRFAKQHSVTAVLDGGDYFHVKAQSKNPHVLNEKTAKLQRAYPCKTYSVEGNHDQSYNNLESISRQPLGVLYATGIFEHLREEVFRDGDLQVRVVGVPYQPKRLLSELRALQKKPGDDFLVAVVHALASEDPPPQVEDFWNEPVFRYSDLQFRDGPDVWMFGHWHRDQGIVRMGDMSFVNQGAGSRGSLVRENLERVPKVSLVEFTKSGYTTRMLPLDVAPALDVFDLEKKEIQEKERKNIEQFVLNLISQTSVDSNASISDNIKSLNFADDIRAEALRYLDLADVG